MSIKIILAIICFSISFFIAISLFLQGLFSNQYRAGKFFKKLDDENETWHKDFRFFIEQTTVGESYFSKKYQEIAREIQIAGVNKTVEQVVIEQFSYTFICFIALGMMYLIYQKIYFGIGAFVISPIMFFEPRSSLKKKAKVQRELIRKETPNFALTVRLLIKGQKTPVDALKLACEYGVGPGLKRYSDRLYMDLDYDNPTTALRKFAWDTEVGEMIEFATSMSQYIVVGPTKEGEEILAQMEYTFRELDKKMLEKEKETRPKKLKIANFSIMICGVFFIMTAIILFMLKIFGGGGM